MARRLEIVKRAFVMDVVSPTTVDSVIAQTNHELSLTIPPMPENALKPCPIITSDTVTHSVYEEKPLKWEGKRVPTYVKPLTPQWFQGVMKPYRADAEGGTLCVLTPPIGGVDRPDYAGAWFRVLLWCAAVGSACYGTVWLLLRSIT